MENAEGQKSFERRKQVLVGSLPNDFLRIPIASQNIGLTPQQAADHMAAMHLQNQMMTQPKQPHVGRLQVTILSAVLNKNYGMTRMDPYVRMRIGHQIFETQTAFNGAKSPRWNKAFQVYQLQKGVNTVHIELFDERTLSEDERIAWTSIHVPDSIWQGETVDEWYTLSGKLGQEQEGTLNLVMSYITTPAPVAPVMMLNPGGGYGYGGNCPTVPVYTLPPSHAVPPNPPIPIITEEDLKQVGEMFPDIDSEVVKSVMEASRGNKEAAINSLLQMQES